MQVSSQGNSFGGGGPRTGPAAVFDGISVEDGASRTVSEDQLSDIIGRIYDAALDSALWTEAIESASEFVGAGIAIPAGDSAAREIAIVATGNVIAHIEFLEARLQQEWTHPQDWINAVTSALKNEWDDPVDSETRRRMQLLIPHVRRAVLIGKTVRLNGAAAAALADALDGVAASVFFVDATNRLLRANESGHALLADRAVLCVHEGRLAASDAGANRLLQDALAATSEGGRSPGKLGVSLPLRASDNRHCVAHILPLTAGARRRAGYAATAVVFVHRAELETPAAPELIARLYGLTPSELRVLLAVFEARGVADIAELLGISIGTAKTHLRRLFAKTGTKRQADLVKLVAAFAARAISP